MVGCECVIHQRVNSVLDRLQFLGSSTTNDLRNDQIHMVRNNLSSHRNRTSDDPDPRWLNLDGSTHPSYDSANSSALQATGARGAHGRVAVNGTQSVQ